MAQAIGRSEKQPDVGSGSFLRIAVVSTPLTVIAAVTTGAPGCAIGEIKREQIKILGLGQFSIAVLRLPLTDRLRSLQKRSMP
jgi:hypothetical protein